MQIYLFTFFLCAQYYFINFDRSDSAIELGSDSRLRLSSCYYLPNKNAGLCRLNDISRLLNRSFFHRTIRIFWAR